MKNFHEQGFDDSFSTDNVNLGHSLAKSPQELDSIGQKFFKDTLPQHQLLIFLSGDCTLKTDDFAYKLQPGDVCFNPALTYYGTYIGGDAPYKRVVIDITPSERFDKLAYEVFDSLKPINVNLKILLPFIERYKEYENLLPRHQFVSFADNLVEELLYICQIEKKSVNSTSDPAETLLKKVLVYIDENWVKIKTVSDITNALFISPSYLYEIFKRKLNIAPKAYLMQKRMQMAHSYLNSGVSPNETSLLVGFATYTSFYRACKTFYGKTPQELWVKNEKKEKKND